MTDKDIIILKYTGYSNDELKCVIYEKETRLSRMEKENVELKKDKEWLDNTNNEQTEVILKLQAQIEKMKNFYNCSHSSRALNSEM